MNKQINDVNLVLQGAAKNNVWKLLCLSNDETDVNEIESLSEKPLVTCQLIPSLSVCLSVQQCAVLFCNNTALHAAVRHTDDYCLHHRLVM